MSVLNAGEAKKTDQEKPLYPVHTDVFKVSKSGVNIRTINQWGGVRSLNSSYDTDLQCNGMSGLAIFGSQISL